MRTRDRWRCFWSWPPGHRFEVIRYFDGVAGRWAAHGRCVCCDRLQGLAIGAPAHGAVFANQPMATGDTHQGVKRSAPPSATSTANVPDDEGPSADVALGDGRRLYVRRVDVTVGSLARRRVYVAHVIGAHGPRAASPKLGSAVARALRVRTGNARVEQLLRQLEHELA
jgi:hypothetical protein